MAAAAIDDLVRVLGGSSVLGKKIVKIDDLRVRVQRGLPYRSLESVVERFHLKPDEVERALCLPTRTRMRRKQRRILSAVESDRLFRLARIASLAAEALGADAKAERWLRKANRALGGQPPLELLDTEIGARQVEDVIGHIEQGVFG